MAGDGLDHRLHQSITLADGRRLGFAEYGVPSGKPVFFFPGTPSGRLFHHPDESIAASVGARVITVDRPGYGLSDFQQGRTLLHWPQDVVQLADALGVDRFAVAGISGGSPCVAACAFGIPERLTASGMISGVGPTDGPDGTRGMSRQRRLGVKVGKYVPWLTRPLLWLASNPQRNAERYFEGIAAHSSKTDRAILARPEIKTMLIDNWVDATRAGLRGYAWETRIFSRPWGFDLKDISVDVHLWHGEEDVSIPASVGRRVAEAIPDCHSTFVHSEGHFLLFEHWREIIGTMVASA
jgi:pimeloyl-ACP methyl ester carboxylesterase